MPRTDVEELFGDLTREIDALEAELPIKQARGHITDVRRLIETLYHTLRENRQLLETILENSVATGIGPLIRSPRRRASRMLPE